MSLAVISKEQCILELKNFSYDRTKLLDIFDQTKQFARVKGLPWKQNPNTVRSPEVASCVVIQYGDHMMLDQSKQDLSCNLLEFDYIKHLINKLNFSHTISPGNTDIIWYRPGFVFEPHIDGYAYSTMMWPIIPEDGGAPIDFYFKDGVDNSPGEYKHLVNEKDIVFSHYYSTTYPTIFNSHMIHGIRKVNQERAYFRLRINETFESILEKYKNEELFKL